MLLFTENIEAPETHNILRTEFVYIVCTTVPCPPGPVVDYTAEHTDTLSNRSNVITQVPGFSVENFAQTYMYIIKSHNKAIFNETLAKSSATKSCNCRNRDQCPLEGNCLEKCLIYKAVVKTEKSTKSYIGCCETAFKTRYSNHKLSLSKKTYSTRTALSKHIWNLKENNSEFKISWSVIAQVSPNFCKNAAICA